MSPRSVAGSPIRPAIGKIAGSATDASTSGFSFLFPIKFGAKRRGNIRGNCNRSNPNSLDRFESCPGAILLRATRFAGLASHLTRRFRDRERLRAAHRRRGRASPRSGRGFPRRARPERPHEIPASIPAYSARSQRPAVDPFALTSSSQGSAERPAQHALRSASKGRKASLAEPA